MPRGQRRAEVSIGARSAKLDRELRKARAKFKRFGDGTKRDLQRSFTGAKRSIGTVTGFAGIGAFGLAAKRTFEFEKRLTRLQIQSGKSRAFMDRMRDSIRRVSSETGVSADALLDGAAQYVSLTGDMDGASAAVETFARVSAASGASMEDIAATAAALRQNLRFDPSEFEKAFSIVLTQGKKGAVELRELSTLLAPLSAQFQEFGNLNAGGLAELGAAMQVMRQGFGTGAEAATGFQSMMTAFAKKAPDFERAGVRIFEMGKDGSKSFRRISDIVTDIGRSRLMKDPTALAKAFGRVEGARAFKKLAENRELFDELVEAGLASRAVAEDLLTFQESAAGRPARAWVRLQNALASAITPERIEKFAAAMEVVADLVGFVADHALEIGIAFATWKLGKGLATLAKLVSSLRAAGGMQALLANAGGGAVPLLVGADGKKPSRLAKVGAGIPAFGFGYEIGSIGADYLDSKGVGPKSLLPIEDRETELEMHRRKARELRQTIETRTELVEKTQGEKLLSFGATFAGVPGQLERKKRVEVGDDFDVEKALKEISFHERQARALELRVNVTVDHRGLVKADAERQRKARSRAR